MIGQISGRFVQFTQNKSFRSFATELAKKVTENDPHKPSLKEGGFPRTDAEWVNAKPFSQVPRISKWFLIKNMLPGGKFHNAPLDVLTEAMFDIYGPIIIFPGMFGRQPTIQLFEPESFEKLFRNEGPYPSRPSLETFLYYRQKVRPDIFKKSGGILTEQGKKWHEFRTISNPLFLKQKSIKCYVPQANEIGDDFLSNIKNTLDPKTLETPADFDKLVSRVLLESMGAIGLNTRLGLLRENENTALGEELVGYITSFFRLSYELDFLPSIWKYVETPKLKKLMKVFDGMTDIILKFTHVAKRRIEADGNENDHTILAQLLKHDEHVAMVMVMDMLMGGIDTTTSVFISTMYHLAKDQKKQDRLREEIIGVLPDKSSPVTAATLNTLPYLKACIKETLRLTPPLVGTGRTLTQDTVLSGYQIPKGNFAVCYTPHVTKSDKYFKDAQKFLPERWLRVAAHPTEACPHAKSENPFAYIPFGFGPRSCIGKGLATMLMETMLLKVFNNYRVEWHHSDMKYRMNILNTPTGDLKFKLTVIK